MFIKLEFAYGHTLEFHTIQPSYPMAFNWILHLFSPNSPFCGRELRFLESIFLRSNPTSVTYKLGTLDTLSFCASDDIFTCKIIVI